MSVNTDRNRQRPNDCRSDVGYLMEHRTTVRVAKHNDISSSFGCGSNSGHCLVWIVLVTIKEMLCVKHDLFSLRLQIRNRFPNHPPVFFDRYAQNLLRMQSPAFADDRYRWSFGGQEKR